jgi:hypothetical protein
MLTRRSLLTALASAPLSAAARPKIALVVTEYRRNAHADVIGTRLLEGYELFGQKHAPRVECVSIYADQVPPNDMSRAMAAKHKLRVSDTVRDALTLGGDKLAVDGVVLIGEHGAYPYNEKGQHMYPRFQLFKQVVDVFQASGRVVPVFLDKHFSFSWEHAKWMYDAARALRIPLMAGSSVPISWRRPEIEWEYGDPMRHAVSAAYGPKEAYGFHALEALQAMAERRKGGETGVRAVQCLDGWPVWEWTDANPWAKRLLEAAVARSEQKMHGEMRVLVRNPSVFAVEYADGLQAAVYLLNGLIQDFTVAFEIPGKPDPISSEFYLQPGRFFSHFSMLVHYIEELMLRKRAPYPVERTLLTTGILAAAMDSAYQKGRRIETPHLLFSYRPPKQSFYNRGPVPALEAS